MEVNGSLVLWCGNAPNQKALANKLHARFGLAGVVIDTKARKKPVGKSPLVHRLFDALRFRKIYSAWKSLQHHYKKVFPSWPDVPVLYVDTINSAEAKTFTEKLQPKLIAVSGTGLVKEPLLSVPAEIGIVNLHTGLSPYVKGGPNCTNWCIANNQWHLVGNTIMWINAGIDTGNIITSETIDIRSCATLAVAHVKVMEHAHDLYLRSVACLLNTKPPYRSIPQSELGKGQLFLSKMWQARQKRQLLANWKNRKKAPVNESPQTVNLPGS